MSKIIFFRLKNILQQLGVNKAVIFGVMSRVWFAIAGVITFTLIAIYFTPEQQGYYFTFYSLLALQVVVELGLLNVIVNFSSHEWSKLRMDPQGNITGDTKALSRLGSLAKAAFFWFALGGVLIFIVIGLSGYLFFSNSHQTGIEWLSPWLSLCLLTGVNLSILPAFALLEGCNQVTQVYFFRFIQELVRFFISWIVIVGGYGLWAPAVSTMGIIIWALIYLVFKYFNFLRTLLHPIIGPKIDWWKEVWPMQWRIAVSWISGYFIYYLFTPFLFYYHGAKVAGQMGMTWSAVNALLILSSMWIVTRVPQFGILIAKKEYGKLDKLMFRSTIIAFMISIFGAISIYGLIYLLNAIQSPYALRFLPPWPTAILLIATVLQLITSSEALYLRAHKIEPFMVVGIISAILMTICLAIIGTRWEALGVALSYLLVTALYMLPHATWIWLSCRKKWHDANDIDLKTLWGFISSEINKGIRIID